MDDKKFFLENIKNKIFSFLIEERGKNKLQEVTSTNLTSGPYTGPVEIGLKKWRDQELGPFNEFIKTPVNKLKLQKTLKNNVKRKVGMWEKHKDSGYDIPTHDVNTIKEDLGVWFGTKKKPKGSSQPKGPWVNICKKDKNGKHPPCGRPEATDKAYPKCRAAGVAGKMSDSEKRNACSQKRKAEKTHDKSGTGNSPKMVSHKKTNEEMKKTVKLTESQLINLIKRVINEGSEPGQDDLVNLRCWSPSRFQNFNNMKFSRLAKEAEKTVLYLLRPSDIPSGEAYQPENHNQGSDEVRFVFEKSEPISTELNLSSDSYFLKNFTGGQKWCFVKMGTGDLRNEAWEEFVKNYNLQSLS